MDRANVPPGSLRSYNQRHVNFQLTPEQEQANVVELSNQPNVAVLRVPADHVRQQIPQSTGHASAQYVGYTGATTPPAGHLTGPPASVYPCNLDSAENNASHTAGKAHDEKQATIVPLSSLPLGALPDLPSDDKDNSKAGSKKSGLFSKHSRHGSKKGASSHGGRSSTAGLSRVLESAGDAADEVAVRVNHPQQVTPNSCVPGRRALKWVGRVGWCGKAVVYAMIGGLACRSAATNYTPAAVAQVYQVSASPQGAFVLLGTAGDGVDLALLIVMMLALLAYIAWRFTEAIRGQGYDKTFSSKKNFFKFRVSPAVSGAVYCSYLVFILDVMVKTVNPEPPGPAKEGWPSTWRYSSLGKAGLALLGLAFLIATIIQLQGVLTKQWHRDYREDMSKGVRLFVFTTGHLGFAGRGAAFLAMAILFLKDASGAGEDEVHHASMVANALQQLQENRGLRAVLMIIGILLIIYGLFAVLSSWARYFPTRPPTRESVTPANQMPRTASGNVLDEDDLQPEHEAAVQHRQYDERRQEGVNAV